MEWKSYPSSKPREGEIVLVCEQFDRANGKHVTHYSVAAFVKAIYGKKRRWAFVEAVRWLTNEGASFNYAAVTHWCRIAGPTILTPKFDKARWCSIRIVTPPPHWTTTED